MTPPLTTTDRERLRRGTRRMGISEQEPCCEDCGHPIADCHTQAGCLVGHNLSHQARSAPNACRCQRTPSSFYKGPQRLKTEGQP